MSLADDFLKDAGVAPSASNSLSDQFASDAVAPVTPNVATSQQPSMLGNIALGALKGATNIGATILSPLDATGLTGMTSDQRRAALNDFYAQHANPDSWAFKGGQLASEVAGTAGAGGVIANGLRAIPGVAAAAPALVNAVESGGMSLGRAASPTVLGKVGDLATRAAGSAVLGGASSAMIDPESAGTGAAIGAALPPALKVGALAGSTAANLAGKAIKNTLGITTGVGSESINNAIRAGANGTTDFLSNLRGDVPMSDVVQQAKDALAKMRLDRSAAYRNGMAQVSGDKTVLDVKPILDAANNVQSMGAYKGQVINKNAAGTVNDLVDQVKHWSNLNPADFHTPEGLDALKQSIGDIRDSTQFGTPARKAADTIYNAVKQQIQDQAPTYAKVMKDYSVASDTLKEVERGLSLGDKASNDTALRKLQSLMRNNAQANYGNRLSLANTLSEQGGQDILPALAGQSMSSWMPRGMVGALEKGGGALGMVMNPAAIPHLLAAAPLASPRLMGEALYKYGQAQGGLNRVLSRSPLALPQGASQSALANRLATQLMQMPVSASQ